MDVKKYKLVNTTTKEETICDKVVVDGFDYYVSDNPITEKWEGFAYKDDVKIKVFKHYFTTNEWYKDSKKVIATNNPNIDIPKVLNEVEILATDYVFGKNGYKWSNNNSTAGDNYGSFIKGYNKAQETHPNSDEDMIEFAKWIADTKLHGYCKQLYEAKTRHKVSDLKELISIWKAQKPKTVYYE